METIPERFSGLIYPPNGESGVYLLLGLLWNHLPYQIAFEEFEIDPHRQGYNHGKWLDAKGKFYSDEKWQDATFEFKLNSSGLLRDIEKDPNIHCDFLICWKHDLPEATLEGYVDKVLCLEDILNALSPDERRTIIFYSERYPKRVTSQANLQHLINAFSQENIEKVRKLIQLWPEVSSGKKEILFKIESRTAFRASAYSTKDREHLTIAENMNISSDARKNLIEVFGATELKRSLNIFLSKIKLSELQKLVAIIREGVS